MVELVLAALLAAVLPPVVLFSVAVCWCVVFAALPCVARVRWWTSGCCSEWPGAGRGREEWGERREGTEKEGKTSKAPHMSHRRLVEIVPIRCSCCVVVPVATAAAACTVSVSTHCTAPPESAVLESLLACCRGVEKSVQTICCAGHCLCGEAKRRRRRRRRGRGMNEGERQRAAAT